MFPGTVLLQDPTPLASASASGAFSPATKRTRNAVILPFHGSRSSEQLASGITGALCYPAGGPSGGVGVGDLGYIKLPRNWRLAELCAPFASLSSGGRFPGGRMGGGPLGGAGPSMYPRTPPTLASKVPLPQPGAR